MNFYQFVLVFFVSYAYIIGVFNYPLDDEDSFEIEANVPKQCKLFREIEVDGKKEKVPAKCFDKEDHDFVFKRYKISRKRDEFRTRVKKGFQVKLTIFNWQLQIHVHLCVS